MSVVYGDTTFINKGKYLKIPAKKKSAYIMPFCHQSVFVKTELLKQHHFDTSFKICADNDFFIKIAKEGHKFYKIDEIIAVYNFEGLSSNKPFRLFFENLRIAQKYNKLSFLFCIPSLCSLSLKFFIKSFIPSSVTTKIKASLYDKS
ncbi:hypothetical protein [Helicobacter cappadocius]|uniref:Glycosyltransferase n=1 Tax=Helicobacter cappadocius TaxID=3063998 RepID=A0AA90PWE1_9HELI|nr:MULTISPECIES: hypothetical protein [unclassified Helicobacter]MDO7253602.1 hypothetical protein [Helicobacter sp. faydin-H75]MDP2539530.1 hypothetical protein [Helicobacter sp. faydin-H76]